MLSVLKLSESPLGTKCSTRKIIICFPERYSTFFDSFFDYFDPIRRNSISDREGWKQMIAINENQRL